jgi:hypothetical protein
LNLPSTNQQEAIRRLIKKRIISMNFDYLKQIDEEREGMKTVKLIMIILGVSGVIFGLLQGWGIL